MLQTPPTERLHDELWRRLVEPCGICKGTGHLVRDARDPESETIGFDDCECKKDVVFRCRMMDANVPREFWDVERIVMKLEQNQAQAQKVIEYCHDLDAAKRNGQGFLLYGQNGVGKTSCACYVLAQASRQDFTIGYITAPEFIRAVPQAWRDADYAEYLRRLIGSDFLVLDECGKEYRASGSEFTTAELDLMLRRRRGALLPTIVSTNLKVKEFRETYGESLFSAMFDRVQMIKFDSGDFRFQLRKRAR